MNAENEQKIKNDEEEEQEEILDDDYLIQLHKHLQVVKNKRKLAEKDTNLINGRVRMLREENKKNLKKIEVTKKKLSIPISPNYSANSTSLNFFSNTISPKINNKSHLHLEIDSKLKNFKLHPLITKQIEKDNRKEKLNSLSFKDFTIVFDEDENKNKKGI